MESDPDNLYTDLMLNWENDQKIENLIRINNLNLNKTNSEGKTLLGMVVSNTNSSLKLNHVVRCLLKHAANPLLPLSKTQPDSIYKYILDYEFGYELVELLYVLIPVDLLLDEEGNTLIHLLAEKKIAHHCNDLLVGYKHTKNKNGETPLHISIRLKDSKSIGNFLKHGSDINEFNDVMPIGEHKGLTPLISCLKDKDIDLDFKHYSFLLKAGADTKATDSSGCTPLHLAVAAKAKSDKCEVMKLLLKHGADVNAKNQSGSTPLIELCRSKESNLMTFIVLLENGADVNLLDDQGYTPLHLAVGNHNDLCHLLVANRANMYAKTHLGVSVFQRSFEDYSVTEKLLECGIDMTKVSFPPTLSKIDVRFCMVCWKYIWLRKSKEPSWKPSHIEEFLECSQKIYPGYFDSCEKYAKMHSEELKTSRIGGTGKTLLDIITSDLDQIVIYMRDERVRFRVTLKDALCHEVNYIKLLNYTYYYWILDRKLNQAFIRCSLLNFFIDNFHVMICRHLPLLCLEKIVSYLGEEALRNVIKTYLLITGSRVQMRKG